MQRVAMLLLLAVVCGCLVRVGIRPSTGSAQIEPALTPCAGRSTVRRERPKRKGECDEGAIAASYSRYSSDNQDDSSIAQQQRKCREAAASNGHDLRPAYEFADEAISGTRSDRVALQSMMVAAKDGKFRIVYFESLSRLARELVITLSMLKHLVYNDRIRIISTSENIDSEQPGWEFMATIRGWMHQEFLTALRNAVLRGQEDGILSDHSVGDWCFGYSSEPIAVSTESRRGKGAKTRMKVVVDPEDADWVRRIFRWYVDDHRSTAWIARELNRLNAPKDHRSRTPHWRQEYVRKLLKRSKYIGIWKWGETTNVRNPLTGKIRKEARTYEEIAAYTRERPELRIIDDETYHRARARLDHNAALARSSRGIDGKPRGVTNDIRTPRHLLQGLLRCSNCGETFRTRGANGKYMACGGYRLGICSVRTMVLRKTAERLILERIGNRILEDAAWKSQVLEATQTAWGERVASRPDESRRVASALVEVEQKIRSIVDAVERGLAGPELAERLNQRRAERAELLRRQKEIATTGQNDIEPPTPQLIDEKLSSLHQLLRSGTPAASISLRALIGPVLVSAVKPEHGKRKFLRASFAIDRAIAVGQNPVSGTHSNESDFRNEVLDLRTDPPWYPLVDQVKASIDAGEKYADIARRLGCPRSWTAKALAYWYRSRNQRPPDGRATRARLGKISRVEALAEPAKALWDRGLLIREIAKELGCCSDTAQRAVSHWYESRGQSVPDGRARRKSLPRRNQTRSDDSLGGISLSASISSDRTE